MSTSAISPPRSCRLVRTPEPTPAHIAFDYHQASCRISKIVYFLFRGARFTTDLLMVGGFNVKSITPLASSLPSHHKVLLMPQMSEIKIALAIDRSRWFYSNAKYGIKHGAASWRYHGWKMIAVIGMLTYWSTAGSPLKLKRRGVAWWNGIAQISSHAGSGAATSAIAASLPWRRSSTRHHVSHDKRCSVISI